MYNRLKLLITMIHIQEEIKVTRIYLVENIDNNPFKVYIGKEKSNKNRKREDNHRKKYGDQIKFDFIDQCLGWDKKDWKPLETFWIQYFKFLGFEIMNIQKNGGSGVDFHTQETKEKLRKANSKPKPLGFGEKISKANKGKSHSSLKGKKRPKELIEKLIKINKGNKYNLGKKRSKETCDKISKANKGKKRSEEFKKHLSEIKKGLKTKTSKKGKEHGNYGKTHFLSKETKQRISNSKKGQKLSKETIIKKSKPILQYDLEGNFLKEWVSSKVAGKFYGRKNGVDICNCCKGRQKTSCGFIWKYK